MLLLWWWYYARQELFIYCLSWLFFTILIFNYFCLDLGVLSNHSLVCQLPSHHHLPVLVVPFPITRQRKLFHLLVHCGILILHSVGILSCYPLWHASSDSNSSFPLLGDMSSQQDISPQKTLSGNPIIDFPFSPPSDHTLSYLWPMTYYSYIGLVQVGDAWALWVLHFRVCSKLVCCSYVC